MSAQRYLMMLGVEGEENASFIGAFVNPEACGQFLAAFVQNLKYHEINHDFDAESSVLTYEKDGKKFYMHAIQFSGIKSLNDGLKIALEPLGLGDDVYLVKE